MRDPNLLLVQLGKSGTHSNPERTFRQEALNKPGEVAPETEIPEVRQKRKSVTHTQRAVHSVGVTQLGSDRGLCMVSPTSPVSVSLACFPFVLVLPGEYPRYLTLSVFHEPLPTVCLYSQVPFFSCCPVLAFCH